jgi:hypothetical protein
MAREFVTDADCSVLYEDWAKLGDTETRQGLRIQASEWVYAEITETHRAPSSALPNTGTTTNFWLRLATASEAIYLGCSRRMKGDHQKDVGYWSSFHVDAVGILEDFKAGRRRLDPEPKIGERGIGPAEAVVYGEAGTDIGESNWIESNTLVPLAVYDDDKYSRVYTIEMQEVGETLNACTFRWKTDGTESGWEAENVKCSWSFIYLSHGVEVRFFPQNIASYETGMKWEIGCHPERDRKTRDVGGETFVMDRM